MNNKSLHEKALRLCEGGIVEINNLVVRAKVTDDISEACLLCEMDSLCDSEVTLLCVECDNLDHHNHYFVLNSNVS